jgi:uncharacterized protein
MIDLNAYIGNWPFHKIKYNTPEKLIELMDRAEISKAAVSPLEAVFYRNVQDANLELSEKISKYKDRLIQLGVINPYYVGWELDFQSCVKELKVKGIKIHPLYHNYNPSFDGLHTLLDLCEKNDLPVFIPLFIEDSRQRHWLDVKSNLGIREIHSIISRHPALTFIIQNAGWQVMNSISTALPIPDYKYYFDLNFVFGTPLDDMDKVIERLTSKNLVLGTGSPFREPEANILKINYTIDDSEARKMIFYQNAQNILKI